MELDHLIPESLGGLTEEENLRLACSLCNDYKSARIAALDTLTGSIVRLFNPRHDVWDHHFRWTVDGELILALTPSGRATVSALNLNRASLVFARRAWVAVGWHPPKG